MSLIAPAPRSTLGGFTEDRKVVQLRVAEGLPGHLEQHHLKLTNGLGLVVTLFAKARSQQVNRRFLLHGIH